MVLAYRNTTLIAEGTGFGLPILRYGHRTVFPGKAEVAQEKAGETTIVAVDYILNLVERIGVRGKPCIKHEGFYRGREAFSLLHRRIPWARKGLGSLFDGARHLLHLETRFESVDPVAVVRVTTTVYPKEARLAIAAKIKSLGQRECTEIIMANEQSASCFDSYEDSSGVALKGDSIGTWNKVLEICEEIRARRLPFTWECLCRVDLIDPEMARTMKAAGCSRVFFGIESASERVLKIMNKDFTPEKARRAVEVARGAGLRTGAFFIVCYPGDTDDSVLETIHFSTSLPLDYLSFTLPYPLPGTALYTRVKDSLKKHYRARGNLFTEHFLIYDGDFSEAMMRFAILKGKAQFRLRKGLGKKGEFAARWFERLTDSIFRMMK